MSGQKPLISSMIVVSYYHIILPKKNICRQYRLLDADKNRNLIERLQSKRDMHN